MCIFFSDYIIPDNQGHIQNTVSAWCVWNKASSDEAMKREYEGGRNLGGVFIGLLSRIMNQQMKKSIDVVRVRLNALQSEAPNHIHGLKAEQPVPRAKFLSRHIHPSNNK